MPMCRLEFVPSLMALITPGCEAMLASADRKSTRLNSSHTEIYTLSLHDALPISAVARVRPVDADVQIGIRAVADGVDHARLRGDAGQRPRRAVEIAVGVDAADVHTAEYHLVGRVGAAVGLEGDLADVDARRQAEGQAVVLLRRRKLQAAARQHQVRH